MAELVPQEAFRYIPTGNKVFTGSGKSIVRFIFYETDFTEFEKLEMEKFKEFLESKQLNISNEVRDEEILRALIGCKFEHEKTLTAIVNSLRWRQENMSSGLESLRTRVEVLLNSGCIYIHGRDHRYRPLIVLNAGRFDLERFKSQDYCDLLCFVLEYCVTHLMIPGKIENWIIITDLNRQGLTSLPLQELKGVIKTLQDNFRCRMIVNYVVNSPRSLKFIWTVVKGFVEEHTVNKIRILREGQPSEIKMHFALSQVEKKYGGTADDLTHQFWPPTLPPGPFESEDDEPGAHLLPRRDDHQEEVFYSVAETTYHSDRRTTDLSRNTVYVDAIDYNEPQTSINIVETPLLGKKPVKQEKKCCEKCLLI
jgi:hypothetical protein